MGENPLVCGSIRCAPCCQFSLLPAQALDASGPWAIAGNARSRGGPQRLPRRSTTAAAAGRRHGSPRSARGERGARVARPGGSSAVTVESASGTKAETRRISAGDDGDSPRSCGRATAASRRADVRAPERGSASRSRLSGEGSAARSTPTFVGGTGGEILGVAVAATDAADIQIADSTAQATCRRSMSTLDATTCAARTLRRGRPDHDAAPAGCSSRGLHASAVGANIVLLVAERSREGASARPLGRPRRGGLRARAAVARARRRARSSGRRRWTRASRPGRGRADVGWASPCAGGATVLRRAGHRGVRRASHVRDVALELPSSKRRTGTCAGVRAGAARRVRDAYDRRT